MSNAFQYLRGYVYPRGQLPQGAGPRRLRGSDVILVMLVVVGIAYAVEVVLF
ncbi:hypothetical protein JNB91_03960 [Rhizobium wenxiniae]|uniref:hypothetical protein n=1 Tax=Rhizobium wenxiniae TaxID=1737357 RepID=UPI001C6DE13B|nr:hypothetical protein [Rhizobium wenxiniae]MBW9086993.1 hypothetical protein [Rhizobium wenxiniae]